MVERITLVELVAASGLSAEEVDELAELGVFQAERSESEQWVFSASSVSIARKARRLRADFDLNPPGLALALTYLEKIEALEARLKELQCQILK